MVADDHVYAFEIGVSGANSQTPGGGPQCDHRPAGHSSCGFADRKHHNRRMVGDAWYLLEVIADELLRIGSRDSRKEDLFQTLSPLDHQGTVPGAEPPRYPHQVAVPSKSSELVLAVASGDRRALARLITLVEEGGAGASEALQLAFGRAVPAHRIGITGAPGSGKSTISDGLVTLARQRGESMGVLAVDPSSPFSGGAVLGDRVRMQDHVLDSGVYIRSMASRGHLGGLSEAAPKALVAMEAAGFDRLLIETVGVGQDEVEVASAADTVLVVLTPGWGDGVQAAKAGILEIGDVFIVNKADRPGVRDTVSDLQSMLALGGDLEWQPPIVETTAAAGEGIAELWEAIERHLVHLGDAGLEASRRTRRRAELRTALAARMRVRATQSLAVGVGADLAAAVEEGDTDPWTAADQLAGI